MQNDNPNKDSLSIETETFSGLIKLKPGSIVEIIAPSSPAESGVLEEAQNYLKSLGLVPKVSSDIYGQDIFYANSNESRTALLKDALLATDSDAIWAIRGGKGAAELIAYLEGKIEGFENLSAELPKEKLLIGLSDFTAIHLFINKFYNWKTLHAPLLRQIVKNEIDQKSKKYLEEVLTDQNAHLLSYDLKKIDDNQYCTTPINGKVVGGNLTIVVSSLGTSWEIETDDKIVFLEDVNGLAYQLERSLTHLIDAGKFNNVKAVILGQFTEISDIENIPKIEDRFAGKFHLYNYLNSNTPVFKLDSVGHGKTSLPLPLNLESVIDIIDDRYHLTVSY